MATKWVIKIQRGATYRSTVTVTGIADISTASLWRIRIGRPDGVNILTATTANGMIVAGASANQKIIVIPAETTASLIAGQYLFDFDIEWTTGTVRVERLYSLGECAIGDRVPT